MDCLLKTNQRIAILKAKPPQKLIHLVYVADCSGFNLYRLIVVYCLNYIY
jgi:hypothetical protein